VSGLFGNFGQTNYGAAKAGIAGFTRSLALEVAKYKCTVNTISPGAATRLTIDLIEAAGRKYDENDWTQGPEQIAPVVTWLCSDAADNVTSQIIHSQAGTLGIMQQPAVIKSFTTENLWTIEQLDALMPELLEAKKHHDDEVSEKGAPEKV
jgi:short-subunit dehydrogenase